MKKKDDIQHYLQELGFSTVEANIFTHLISHGQKTILEISRALAIPRTTLYDAVTKLVDQGYLEKIILFKTHKYQAASLDFLSDLIKQKKEKINLFAKIIPELKIISQQMKAAPYTNVRYYHGKQGIMQIHWNILNAKKKIIGYSESGLIDLLGKKFQLEWYNEIIRRGIKDQVIINPQESTLRYHFSPPENKYREQFQSTRYVTQDQFNVTGDTTIYNNTFAICYWKKGEVFGVEIENEEFVKHQTSLFNLAWGIANPIIG